MTTALLETVDAFSSVFGSTRGNGQSPLPVMAFVAMARQEFPKDHPYVDAENHRSWKTASQLLEDNEFYYYSPPQGFVVDCLTANCELAYDYWKEEEIAAFATHLGNLEFFQARVCDAPKKYSLINMERSGAMYMVAAIDDPILFDVIGEDGSEKQFSISPRIFRSHLEVVDADELKLYDDAVSHLPTPVSKGTPLYSDLNVTDSTLTITKEMVDEYEVMMEHDSEYIPIITVIRKTMLGKKISCTGICIHSNHYMHWVETASGEILDAAEGEGEIEVAIEVEGWGYQTFYCRVKDVDLKPIAWTKEVGLAGEKAA